MTISDLHLECRAEETKLHDRIAELEGQLKRAWEANADVANAWAAATKENKALREAAEKLLSPVIREALAAHESQRRILNPVNRLNTHVVLYLEDLYILQAALLKEGGDEPGHQDKRG